MQLQNIFTTVSLLQTLGQKNYAHIEPNKALPCDIGHPPVHKPAIDLSQLELPVLVQDVTTTRGVSLHHFKLAPLTSGNIKWLTLDPDVYTRWDTEAPELPKKSGQEVHTSLLI